MNKRLLVAGILAVVVGVIQALAVLVPLPYGPQIPVGRTHELLVVSAVRQALPLLLVALALLVLQAALARQTGSLGWVCTLAEIIGIGLAAGGVAARSVATSYACALDAACQGQSTPSSRALDTLHMLGIIGALVLAAALLAHTLVALRARLPLCWAGVFVVLCLAALALLPLLLPDPSGSLYALTIGFPGLALPVLWIAACFLLAGAALSTPTPAQMPTSAAVSQP